MAPVSVAGIPELESGMGAVVESSTTAIVSEEADATPVPVATLAPVVTLAVPLEPRPSSPPVADTSNRLPIESSPQPPSTSAPTTTSRRKPFMGSTLLHRAATAPSDPRAYSCLAIQASTCSRMSFLRGAICCKKSRARLAASSAFASSPRLS